MKLSELGQSVGRIVSNQEIDLERKVVSATVVVELEGQNGQIILHEWDYQSTPSQKVGA